MKKQIFYTFITLIISGLTFGAFGMETSQPTQELISKPKIAPTIEAIAGSNTYKWLIKNPATARAQVRYAKKYGFGGNPVITQFKMEINFSDDKKVDENGISLSNNNETFSSKVFTTKVFTKGMKYLRMHNQTALEKISIADMNSDVTDKNEEKEMNKAFLSLEELPSLTKLKIKGGEGNDIDENNKAVLWKKIPENIGFVKVTQLNLENLQLEEIPVTICYMDVLQKLDLSNNKLTSLPDQIGKLSNLKCLRLDSNELEKLPKTINRLAGLNFLSFYCNQLSKFPELLGDLPNLEEVHGERNQITSWAPITQGKFPNLKYITVKANQLTRVPQGIEHVQSLEKLDLKDNKIRRVPLELGSLKNLRRVYLKENPIQSMPPFKEMGLLLDTEITFDAISNNNNNNNLIG